MSIILDLKCAEYGRQLSQLDVNEKNLNEAIDVLREDGVYAMFLYLDSKVNHKEIQKKVYAFLRDTEIWGTPQTTEEYKIENLRLIFNADINKLFLARELMEGVLAYALYHNKAKTAAQGGG